MRLIYRPTEGDPQEFAFDPFEVTAEEAEELEKPAISGGAWSSFDSWVQAYHENRHRARRAAVWLILRREDKHLAFDGFAPRAKQIGWKYEVAELLSIRKTWTGIDTDDARIQVEAIDFLLSKEGVTAPADDEADDSADPEAAGDDDPKAQPSPKRSRSRRKPAATPADGVSTDGPSPSA